MTSHKNDEPRKQHDPAEEVAKVEEAKKEELKASQKVSDADIKKSEEMAKERASYSANGPA